MPRLGGLGSGLSIRFRGRPRGIHTRPVTVTECLIVIAVIQTKGKDAASQHLRYLHAKNELGEDVHGAWASRPGLQRKVWAGRLPLEIRLSNIESRVYDRADPYLISCPRLAYLPVLLSKLHAFFSPFFVADPSTVSPYDGYFTHDSVPLKWHLPLGLLYDIYVLSTPNPGVESTPGNLTPFRLTLHFSSTITDPPNQNVNFIRPEPVVLHDAFINSVKEADFLRSGTAKPIMSLSAADSKALWSSTHESDLSVYSKIHASLLPPVGQFRNIPLRLYLPSSPTTDGGQSNRAQIKVLQSHIPPTVPATQRLGGQGQPQTLGTALHTMLPSLFPSRRTPILARPILHGVPVPMASNVEDLARWACYPDGWLGVVVVMNN